MVYPKFRNEAALRNVNGWKITVPGVYDRRGDKLVFIPLHPLVFSLLNGVADTFLQTLSHSSDHNCGLKGTCCYRKHKGKISIKKK